MKLKSVLICLLFSPLQLRLFNLLVMYLLIIVLAIPNGNGQSITDNEGPSVSEERQITSKEFEESGKSDDDWTRNATVILKRIVEATSSDKSVPIRCYNKGCIVTVRYQTLIIFVSKRNEIAKSAFFQKWPGGKECLAPDNQKDGSIVADWILLRPLQAYSSKGGTL